MKADEVFGRLCDDGVCMVASWGFLKTAFASQGRCDVRDLGAQRMHSENSLVYLK